MTYHSELSLTSNQKLSARRSPDNVRNVMTEESLSHVVGTTGQRDQPFFYSWVRIILQLVLAYIDDTIRIDEFAIFTAYHFETSISVRPQEDREERQSLRMIMTSSHQPNCLRKANKPHYISPSPLMISLMSIDL